MCAARIRALVWEKRGETLVPGPLSSAVETSAVWEVSSPAFLGQACRSTQWVRASLIQQKEDQYGPGFEAVGTGLSGLRDR